MDELPFRGRPFQSLDEGDFHADQGAFDLACLEGRFANHLMETWKHLRAILLLPGMLAVVIPGTILLLTGLDTLGLRQSYPAACVGLPVLGGATCHGGFRG
jgi:hypothetical protein